MLSAFTLIQIDLNAYLTLRGVILIATNKFIRVIASKDEIDAICESR